MCTQVNAGRRKRIRGLAASVGVGVLGSIGFQAGAMAQFVTGFETSDDPDYIVGEDVVVPGQWNEQGVDGWYYNAGPPEHQPDRVRTTIVDENYVPDLPRLVETGNDNPGVVRSGSQALLVATNLTNSHRVARQFEPLTGQVSISVSLAYDDGTNWSRDAISYVYFGEAEGTSESLGVQFGFVGDLTEDEHQIAYNDGGSTVTIGQFQPREYYDFLAEVDLDAGTYDLSVTGPGINFTSSDPIAFRDSSVETINWVRFLNNRQQSEFFADDLAIVPEPSVGAILAMSGFWLMGRRRA